MPRDVVHATGSVPDARPAGANVDIGEMRGAVIAELLTERHLSERELEARVSRSLLLPSSMARALVDVIRSFDASGIIERVPDDARRVRLTEAGRRLSPLIHPRA